MSTYSRYLHFPPAPKWMQYDERLTETANDGNRRSHPDLRRKMFRRDNRKEARAAEVDE